MAGLTESQCRNSFQKFIQKVGFTNKFFPTSSSIDGPSRNGPRNADQWVRFAQTMGIFTSQQAKDNALDMLNLALYDIHFLIDDSGSLKHNPNSISSMKDTISLLLGIVRLFMPQGVRLHFFNGDDPANKVTTGAELDSIWAAQAKFGGPSKLGTALKDIWSPIITNHAAFTRPQLLYVFTDMDTTGEPDAKLVDSLGECRSQLLAAGYSAASIAVNILQLEDDKLAREFQQRILNDLQLADHVDLIIDDDDIENDVLQRAGKPRQDPNRIMLRKFVGALL